MNFPSYYTVLDLTEGLAGRAKALLNKSDDPALAPVHSSRKKILLKATRSYDNLVGRFDTPNKVPSRELVPPADALEEKAMRRLGATRRDDGQWVVPDELDIEKFEMWWPMVPEDLRDETPRMLLTRDGRKIETRLAVGDVVRGDDSTATSLLYGGFVAVAITAYLLFHIHPVLGALALLGFIPFTLAMSHAESPGEAVKSLTLVGLGPLVLASAAVKLTAALSGAGALGQMAAQQAAGGGLTSMLMAAVGALLLVPMVFIAAMVFAFVAASLDDNREAGVVGGTFGKFKAIVKWSFVYTGAFVLMMLLPDYLKAAVPFLLAALYPMVYINGNFTKRHKELKIQGLNMGFNLGKQGALAQAHVIPKLRQAERALKDKSPKFIIGHATGVLTEKQLPDAPDQGVPMVLTDHDMSRHLFYFGATGSGKTESGAKNIAAQWVANGCGGMLVLDGKGALPGDLRELIDVMIAPGVNFAPFEGLDGHGITLALNAVASAGGDGEKHGIWMRGANQFCARAFKIWEALHTHERAFKQYAADVAARKELEIDALMVEIAQLELTGEDMGEARAKLQAAQKSYNSWASTRDEPRKWLWNVDTCIYVIDMIEEVVRDPKTQLEVPGKNFQDAVHFLGWGVDPAERARNPREYHPEIGTGGLLDGAINYVFHTWCGAMEAPQRSSFHINVVDRVLPLAIDPYMVGSEGVHWKTLEKGVDAGVCLKGQSVGVYLPKEKHRDSGALVAALVKQRIYDSVALRAGDDPVNPQWRARGETPILLLCDECQNLVDEAELDLLPKARSLFLRAVFLTQELEGLIVKFGSKDKAHQFVNTFQSFVVMKSSPATQEYVDKRLGVAPLVQFKQPTKGVDFMGALNIVADSPLNDVDHPGRAVMRSIEKTSGLKFMFRAPTDMSRMWSGSKMVSPEDGDVSRGIMVPGGGQLVEGPLITPAEHRALIRTGRAIVHLMRAGEPRIDIADLSMVTKEQIALAVAAKEQRAAEREAQARAAKRARAA